MTLQNQALRITRNALNVAPLVPATLLLTSCDSTSIPGIQNLNVGIQNQHLYAGFVAERLDIDGGLTMPIPELKGATIGINPNLDTHVGGTVFQLDVDLTQLSGKNFAVAGLPDGRPLPDVDGGMLPRWAFKIGNVPVYVYLANGAFSIFVPVELVSPQGYALPTLLSKEVDDERGNMLGKVYAIPAQGAGTASGLMVLIAFVNPQQMSN